jgi:hypothetical protein
MMRASASLCRLRAAARLALARRAVARRTDRAAGAAGLCSETWARTSTGAIVSSSVRHLRHQRRMLSVAFSIEAVPSLAWAAHGVRGTRSPERSLGNTATTETVQQRPNGIPAPQSRTAGPGLPPRGADRAVGGIRAGVGDSGRRASTTIDSTPIHTPERILLQMLRMRPLGLACCHRPIPTMGGDGLEPPTSSL